MNKTSQTLEWRVEASSGGTRLDRLVAQRAGVSRRVARLWIRGGAVRVNGKVVRVMTRPIRAGARLQVEPQPEDVAEGFHPELRIIFCDAYLVVVDKPAGLLSEPDRLGSPSVESLLPRLLAAQGEHGEVRLVHRLDAGTSGVMVIARRNQATRGLNDAFRQGKVRKTYLGLCVGRVAAAQRVDAAIRKKRRGMGQEVAADGKPSRTHVEPLAASDQASLVRAIPRTGRTHQIRVHMQHIGHPLLGDRLYGGLGYEPTGGDPIARPMLHAARLVFSHPKTGEEMAFEAPMPVDFERLVMHFGLSVKGSSLAPAS